jgi:predicted ATPase
MIFAITLCATHRYRVRHDRTIRFDPAVNVLVGPNGSGKSTLLRALQGCPDCRVESAAGTRLVLHEAHARNPQEAGFRKRDRTDGILETRGLFSSHGEIMRDVLATLAFGPGDSLLLDEPESGQDFAWVERIAAGLRTLCVSARVQVIIATHHPILWTDARLIELAPDYARQVRAAMLSHLADER